MYLTFRCVAIRVDRMRWAFPTQYRGFIHFSTLSISSFVAFLKIRIRAEQGPQSPDLPAPQLCPLLVFEHALSSFPRRRLAH